MNVVLWLTLINVGACSATYKPPPQTEAQVKAYANFKADAATASIAARTHVLALFDDADVRAALEKCCPSIAALSSSELLNRYIAEVAVSEIAHGFPAQNIPEQINALDLDIDIALNSSWFLNQWQLPLLYSKRELTSVYSLIAYLAPAGAMEVETWKLNPFTAANPFGDNIWPGGWPADLQEASDRLVYAVLNQHQLDFPNSNWGNVGVVFKTSYVRNMTILTAVDSGDFVCACDTNFTTTFCKTWTNETACNKFWYCSWENDSTSQGGICTGGHAGDYKEHNCTEMNPFQSGTLDHFNHLIIPYAKWYNTSFGFDADRVALLLGRTLLPWGTAPDFIAHGFDFYFEADLLGNPHFPEGVHFVVATIADLFGSTSGDKVVKWCLQNKWVLIWSLGPNMNKLNASSFPSLPDVWKSNTRIADPRTTTTTNMTVSPNTTTTFQQMWLTASNARQHSVINNVTAVDWWNQLHISVGKDLQLKPIRANSCGVDTDNCFGVLYNTDQCACYNI